MSCIELWNLYVFCSVRWFVLVIPVVPSIFLYSSQRKIRYFFLSHNAVILPPDSVLAIIYVLELGFKSLYCSHSFFLRHVWIGSLNPMIFSDSTFVFFLQCLLSCVMTPNDANDNLWMHCKLHILIHVSICLVACLSFNLSLSVPSVYRLVIAHIFHALHMCVNGACVHVRVKKSKINMLPLCLVSMYMTIDHIDDAYMSISFVCMCDHIIGLGMWTLVFFLHLWLSVACTLLLLSCNVFHVINVVCVCELMLARTEHISQAELKTL